jgi:hypothetical protein
VIVEPFHGVGLVQTVRDHRGVVWRSPTEPTLKQWRPTRPADID